MYYNHGRVNGGVYGFSKEALNNGEEIYGTHEGLIYFDGNNWKIRHNIHGKIHDGLLERNLGSKNNPHYAVTAIYDPKYEPKLKLKEKNIFEKIFGLK